MTSREMKIAKSVGRFSRRKRSRIQTVPNGPPSVSEIVPQSKFNRAFAVLKKCLRNSLGHHNLAWHRILLATSRNGRGQRDNLRYYY